MKQLISLAFFFLISFVTGYAQNNSALLGHWKNADKNSSVTFLIEANGKGARLVESTNSATDKCNCISSMKFPFSWFVKHDTLFLMYDIEKASFNSSVSAKPGVAASDNEISDAKSFCHTLVQFVFMGEKSEYEKAPNQRARFSIAGNNLLFGRYQYIKEQTP